MSNASDSTTKTTKSVKIFDRIRDRVKPILVIEDLELTIYHPNILSKEISLAIFDSQIAVDFLNDQVIQKSEELAALRDSKKLDPANLKKRQDITKEISGLNDKIDAEISTYIESLAKLKPGTLAEKLAKIEFTEDYPREKLTADIFTEVNLALREHNAKEYNVDSEAEKVEGDPNPT